MRAVAVVGFVHSGLDPVSAFDEVELTQQVCSKLRGQFGLSQQDIGFTVSGSCDFLSGRPFSFVSALDGVGAFPPIRESHVEMDGAFALYEAWVRLQHGDIDTALVYAFGQPSQADLNHVLGLQLDPHWAAPLGLDEEAVCGLQARAAGSSEPLQRVPQRDGAAAILLAAGDRATELCAQPAWIRGIDHRIDAGELGQRTLGDLPSARRAAEQINLADQPLDGAELHVSFTHQLPMLQGALGLAPETPINRGESSACDVFMVSGLMRLGEAAAAVISGDANCMLGHAAGGPALQQNLLCLFGDQP